MNQIRKVDESGSPHIKSATKNLYSILFCDYCALVKSAHVGARSALGIESYDRRWFGKRLQIEIEFMGAKNEILQHYFD